MEVKGIIARISKHGKYKNIYIPSAVSSQFKIGDYVVINKIKPKYSE